MERLRHGGDRDRGDGGGGARRQGVLGGERRAQQAANAQWIRASRAKSWRVGNVSDAMERRAVMMCRMASAALRPCNEACWEGAHRATALREDGVGTENPQPRRKNVSARNAARLNGG
ncbi:hypothetical protein HBI56_183650 [Parastagonospora nodorum]|uniref:Uncharacterized protein n=1 Tax=Phaeosphaeria nodorum (strain SN15 / ATCC MYA-4574 / FGSC 10173) TaxID=321614 RepID=A0A7U2FF17_PHANO|nr:hypothetical protein HBH56_192120 [Parastagonospora nodorum]QRD03054.1 hypothetical protein JI435_419010 [Parastagonospora nodorum SN15]KAH3938157.1 hypothetical protein HBH54_009860 [Parastagonospora nodorum]KAH3940813.1 hypothetical protein HBH53_212470 [Parastagonospora nodorum]KAH3994172.1 hypothetical protein HBI10_189680 [Parastagonospora nodorum]